MSRKGTSLAERRARGIQQGTIRMSPEYWAKLDQLCEESGHSRSEHIEAWIDLEEAELAALKQ